MLLLPALLLACTPLLDAPSTYDRGDGPSAALRVIQSRPHTRLAEAVDLNGDGVDELLGFDGAGFPVVGVQKSDGTYHFEWLPALGRKIAAGDPNEHGWQTLLVGGADLGVLSRSPQGVWSRVRTIPGAVYGVASEDLDGDGKREILVVHDRHLRVLAADGDERFSMETEWPALFRLFVADVNGDAKPDLIVMRRGTESPVPHPPILSDGFLSIHLGRGDATFEPETRLLDEQLIDNVAAGDFNGDAITDILVSADSTTLLLRGDGRGGFARRRAPAGWTHATDLNGDGILDVLTSDLALYQGTRGGPVRLNEYGLPRAAFVFPRRAPDARPSLLGVTDEAGQIFVVDVLCGTSRGRATRH